MSIAVSIRSTAQARLHGFASRVSARREPLTPRRTVQVALGLIWLLDAALQFQPFMFTHAFVTETLASNAAGNPGIVADPIVWSSDLVASHVVVANASFALLQLCLALGILWRRTTKPALGASVLWALAVWWLGEGFGGILTGQTSAFMGAPGAAFLYALIAVLCWPRERRGATTSEPAGDPGDGCVAMSGPLGRTAPRVAWTLVWGSFVWFSSRPGEAGRDVVSSMLRGMASGEPDLVRSLDGALAQLTAGRGAWVVGVFAVLAAVGAASVWLPWHPLRRFGIGVAIALGLAIWVAENFGQVLTGQGTDPSTGPLLVLFAVAFWPRRPARGDLPAAT